MAYGRYVKPSPFSIAADMGSPIVAPHYFKAADLEQLATGDRKMPKAVGASVNHGS